MARPSVLRLFQDRSRQKRNLVDTVRVAAARTGLPLCMVTPVVLGVLLPPIATASVSLIWASGGGDVVLGTFGVVLCVTLTVWQCRLLCTTHFGSVARRRRHHHRRGTGCRAFFLRRSWSWHDNDPHRSATMSVYHRSHFTAVYGSLFDGTRRSAHWWGAAECAVGIGSACVCGLLPTDPAACDTIVGVVRPSACFWLWPWLCSDRWTQCSTPCSRSQPTFSLLLQQLSH